MLSPRRRVPCEGTGKLISPKVVPEESRDLQAEGLCLLDSFSPCEARRANPDADTSTIASPHPAWHSAGPGQSSSSCSQVAHSSCSASDVDLDELVAGGSGRVSEQGCVARLEILERALSGEVDRLSSALSATEADCYAILDFFGLETPKGSLQRLSAHTSQLLLALHEWLGQLRGAWEDLERYRNAEKRRLSKRNVVT
eukprot:TRINITY_DN8506_c0_g1_i2.p1 TRINITY_DN8506_c0_g1~~TRINITY_DN8506_c0_g1_i2.p1  ORF type:complete len:199 (-),score=22.43 TRINITY_DN8506_c0_g1_i2:6-602(-)